MKKEELMIGDWVYNTHNRKPEQVCEIRELTGLLEKCPLASSLRRCSGERSSESAAPRLTGVLKGGAAADAVGDGAAGPRPLGIPTGRRLLPARTRSLARARTGRKYPQTDAPALLDQVAASLRQSVRSSLLRPTIAQA